MIFFGKYFERRAGANTCQALLCGFAWPLLHEHWKERSRTRCHLGTHLWGQSILRWHGGPGKLLVDSFWREIPLHQLHECLLRANVLLFKLGKLLFIKNCGSHRHETKEAPCIKTPIIVLGTAIHNSYGS